MKKILLASLLATLATLSAQAQQARKVFATTVVAADTSVLETGTGVQYHQLVWNVSGTVSTCQVTLQSSADNITFGGTVIAAQTCTSNGLSAISTAIAANYVRINVTTKSGSGTVTVTYLGYTNQPSGGGTVTGTGVSGQVATWSGASSLNGNANFTFDGTNHWLTVNAPVTPGICCGSAFNANLTVPGTGGFTATIPTTAAGGSGGFFAISQATPANYLTIEPFAVGQGTPPTYADLLITAFFNADGSLYLEPSLNVSGPIFDIFMDNGVSTRPYVNIGPFAGGHVFSINHAGATDVNNASTSTQQGFFNVRGVAPSGDCDHFGDPCLLYINQEAETSPALAINNKLSAAGYATYQVTNTGLYHFNTSPDGTKFAGQFTDAAGEIYEFGQDFVGFNNGEAKVLNNGTFNGTKFATATDCASSTGVCGSAAAGAFTVAAAATTRTVATTAVSANSVIILQFDSSLGTKLGVTCNTTVDLGQITARVAATSFTVTAAAAPAVNPACYSYWIVSN